jgi:hypothetical protein
MDTSGSSTSKSYGLARLVFGSNRVLSINKSEYDGLSETKARLLDALFIEQKFDLVVENYLELEQELLSSTARFMLHGDTDYRWFALERALINRRLLNLLSVCRGYIDHIQGVARRILGQADAAAFDAIFRQYYDATFGYRVMEAIRNHVQHRGFPIHVLEYAPRLEDKETRNRFPHEVAIYTKTVYLREGDFKASVLAELEALGGRVDVKPLIRDYIDCLASIHEQYRKLIQTQVSDWDSAVLVAIDRYAKQFPDEPSVIGLAAVVVDGPRRLGEVPLFRDLIKHRQELESKNRGFANLRARFVSGATTQ